jgi:hypothetical protein
VSPREPKWHGADLDAAKRRARHLGGCVVRSWGPGARAEQVWGYWSEEERGPFLRTGEELVYRAPLRAVAS